MIRKTKTVKPPQRARQFSSRPFSSRLKSSAKVSRRKTPWATSTTLERACELLKLFTPKKPRWTISELARYLNVPKSGVFRLVKTLHFLRCHDGTYKKAGWPETLPCDFVYVTSLTGFEPESAKNTDEAEEPDVIDISKLKTVGK